MSALQGSNPLPWSLLWPVLQFLSRCFSPPTISHPHGLATFVAELSPIGALTLVTLALIVKSAGTPFSAWLTSLFHFVEGMIITSKSWLSPKDLFVQCQYKKENWKPLHVLKNCLIRQPCEAVANAAHSWSNNGVRGTLCLTLSFHTVYFFSSLASNVLSPWSMSICTELFLVKSLLPHLLILVLASALFLSWSFELLPESEINCVLSRGELMAWTDHGWLSPLPIPLILLVTGAWPL